MQELQVYKNLMSEYENLCSLLDDPESYIPESKKRQVLAMNGLIELNIQ